MHEQRFWNVLATICAVLSILQLPFSPSRFGGIFFLALCVGCAGESLALQHAAEHWPCAVIAHVGRILFALFVLSFAYIQLFEIEPGIRTDASEVNVDYVLVLGALVNPDGYPSAALAARCDTAVDYLAAHPDTKAILCGGQGWNEPRSEAEAMYDYMIARGVDAGRLIKEDQSRNTIENIQNAQRLIQKDLRRTLPPEELEHIDKFESVAVITNDYHLTRAMELMHNITSYTRMGIPAPTPHPGQWISVRCREYCSILGLMLSGRW